MAGPRKLPWTFTHLFKIQQYSLFCMCNCSTTILYLKVHNLLPKLTAVHLINTTKHAELHWKWTSNRCGPAKDNKTCQLAKNSLLMCCALSTFLWKMLRMENLLIWIIWRAISGTINSALKVLRHHVPLHHPGALKHCHLEDIWSEGGGVQMKLKLRKYWAISCKS